MILDSQNQGIHRINGRYRLQKISKERCTQEAFVLKWKKALMCAKICLTEIMEYVIS